MTSTVDVLDVLIVGGGPAGSSCAWALRHSGLDVAIIDKQIFPRDKVCGGWITPHVLTALDLDPADYAQGRVFQPITGFKVGRIGAGSPVKADYCKPVSYGIRRREFDEYLLRRSGACVHEGVGFTTLERAGPQWIVNGNLHARLIVGAAGHFCPVARHFRTSAEEAPVVAQEIEFEMDASQAAHCGIRPDVPEIYFCPDMKGYGWCFRKANYLNVGLGRADKKRLPEHVGRFIEFIGMNGLPAMSGHAYLLHGASPRPIFGDGYLLIGDAAGLAYAQSGEGILTAIQSGILAAETIINARGEYTAGRLSPYATGIAGRVNNGLRLAAMIPAPLVSIATRSLFASAWFTRKIILDRWFLHCE
jgi:flavin-dependent dehydrogenase